MSVPQRQKEYRTVVIVVTVVLTLYAGMAVYISRDYFAWSRLVRQYHATLGQARDIPVTVVSQDEYRHGRRRTDYVLGLRQPGGAVQNVSVISRDLWSAVSIGDTVTAHTWHSRVRRVQARGLSSPTTADPDYRTNKAKRSAATLGLTWLFYAALAIWGLSRQKRRIMQAPLPSTERLL